MYWGQPHLWLSHNIFLHLDLSQASFLQSPFFLISFFNTSLHLFLGLSFTPLPSTCSVTILFIQHKLSLLAKPPQPVLLHDFSNVINCQHAPHTLLFLSLKLTPVPSQYPHFTPLYFPYILYLCWPCLTAIQHCMSYACCIDNSSASTRLDATQEWDHGGPSEATTLWCQSH